MEEVNGVQFLEEEYQASHRSELDKKRSGLTEWLVTQKIAKDTTQATYILLGILLASLITMVAIVYFTSPRSVAPPREVRLRDMQMTTQARP